MKPQSLIAQQGTMNQLLLPGMRYELVLADGSHWEIAAEDEEAASIVFQLGCAMQLPIIIGAT